MRHVLRKNDRRGSPEAGEFQEEIRNVEATVRIQHQEQMFTGKNEQKIERCPDCVRIQQDFCFFCSRSRNETYVKKL
jgi:hypothetical protein